MEAMSDAARSDAFGDQSRFCGEDHGEVRRRRVTVDVEQVFQRHPVEPLQDQRRPGPIPW
ncbi:hypothetical protein [Streptomyces sp. NPDC058755]|uniref:hypothetical protein n=1 Tax=Streptomyces sp. NPDC058755 TaxID=3346624 RepID=UPI00368FC5A9